MMDMAHVNQLQVNRAHININNWQNNDIIASTETRIIENEKIVEIAFHHYWCHDYVMKW